ncbi:hypothetical protein J0S82_002521, partial [Galemys pyrenaicus]
ILLRPFDWLVVETLMREEWKFSTMASGVQFVMTTGNCVVDRSSVGVWATKVFIVCTRKLILDKVLDRFGSVKYFVLEENLLLKNAKLDNGVQGPVHMLKMQESYALY